MELILRIFACIGVLAVLLAIVGAGWLFIAWRRDNRDESQDLIWW